jgi:hypothetical protein
LGGAAVGAVVGAIFMVWLQAGFEAAASYYPMLGIGILVFALMGYRLGRAFSA